MKSGSFNLLEPSRPVEACNGIALPLPTSQKAGIYVGETILTEILTVLSADPQIVVALPQKGPQPLLCSTHNHHIKWTTWAQSNHVLAISVQSQVIKYLIFSAIYVHYNQYVFYKKWMKWN
jgi:hypothetical protein